MPVRGVWWGQSVRVSNRSVGGALFWRVGAKINAKRCAAEARLLLFRKMMMVVSSQRSDHATGSVWTRRTEAALARGHKQGPQRRTAGERRRAARQWQARSVFLLSELQRRGARFRSAPFVWAHDPKSPKTWHGAARAGASSESRSLFQPVVPWADRTACSHSSIFFPFRNVTLLDRRAPASLLSSQEDHHLNMTC